MRRCVEVMYRRVILTLYQRSQPFSVSRDTPLTSSLCKHRLFVPAFRTSGQISQRVFSGSGVYLCEKKEGTVGSPLEEVNKETETTEVESSSLAAESETNGAVKLVSNTEEQTTEKIIGEPEKNNSENKAFKQASPLNTEATSESVANIQSPDWTTETRSNNTSLGNVQTESPQKTEDNEKTSKKGLLELLGAMKVEVTTKRKLRAPKVQHHEQVAPPRPDKMESTTSMFQQASEDESQSETLSQELVAAVSSVAAILPDSSQAKSELLQQLQKHEAVSQAQRRGEMQDIGHIIADMKVGKRLKERPNARPANQIRFDDDGRGYTIDLTGELDGVRRRKSPFLAKRLNIFPTDLEEKTQTDLSTAPTLWDADLAAQIVQVLNQHPRNGFEEMIQWTKEGRLWTYPINNEAGMEEEASVPFHEHVFLDRHLEDGFPKQGPIRHFMELVVTGLSKNHHLTVRQKLEHIAWFREYFQQKQDVLKEAEAN